MKRLAIVPDGWECALAECRPGHFVFEGRLCFKDEYGSAGNSYNDAGEVFWGGTSTDDDRQKLVVQPVAAVWEDYED